MEYINYADKKTALVQTDLGLLYTDFLKKLDPRVPNNEYHKQGRESKPFVGIVLKINEHKYLAPLTSYKPKQDKLPTGAPTLVKLYEIGNPDNKLGMIQLNNMIPVLDSEIMLLDIENQEETYRNLLRKQSEFVRQEAITEKIQRKAKKLYELVVNKKVGFFCGLSCDFKMLEEQYQNFGQEPPSSEV